MKPTYKVVIEPHAWRELMSLPPNLQTRLFTAIEELELDPRPAQSTNLQGAVSTYRLRIGDYRIVYEVHDAALLVVVVKVGHRREVYRRR